MIDALARNVQDGSWLAATFRRRSRSSQTHLGWFIFTPITATEAAAIRERRDYDGKVFEWDDKYVQMLQEENPIDEEEAAAIDYYNTVGHLGRE